MNNRFWQWHNTQWYGACQDAGIIDLFALTALAFLMLETLD